MGFGFGLGLAMDSGFAFFFFFFFFLLDIDVIRVGEVVVHCLELACLLELDVGFVFRCMHGPQLLPKVYQLAQYLFNEKKNKWCMSI
jgi:hypothetical protein